MLTHHVDQLYKDFDLGIPPSFDKDGILKLTIASYPIQMRKLDVGAYFSALIGPLPTLEREEFLLKLMKANFLGQGTGGGVVGLKEDESFLTLSLNLPYEMDYTSFKEAVEEFINYLEYWKGEIERHERDRMS